MKLSRVIVYGLLGILAWFVLFYNPKVDKNNQYTNLQDNVNLGSGTANITLKTIQNAKLEENSLHYEYKRNPFVLTRTDVIMKGEEPTGSIDTYEAGTGGYYTNNKRSGSIALQGITVVGNKKSAIINGEVVNIGNSVGGYRVVGINKKGVVINSGGKNITIKVSN